MANLTAFARSTRIAKRVGTLPTAWHMLRHPTEYLERRAKEGDSFWLALPAADPLLVILQPDVVKSVFADDALTAGHFNRTLSPFLGDRSVLMVDGKAHLRKRRLLLPPFHGERMHAYGKAMMDAARASIARWPVGQPFAIHRHMQRVTLEVIVHTIFGVRPGDAGPLLDNIEKVLGIGAWAPLLLPFFRVDLGPRSPWGRFLRESNALRTGLDAEIERCRREGTTGREDILALLVDARDEDGQPMPAEELRDELVTLLVAGHETTATSLAWTLHAVLHDPNVKAHLLDELAGPRDPERIGKLEYLDAVVKEGLRLRPVVPFVGRLLSEPRTIAGHDLGVGAGVAVPIYLLHRRADLYPEPRRFRPERFLERKYAPWEYLPFGGGIRRCLGMAFAMYELKMVLATVLLEADLALAEPGEPDVVRRSITFAPKGGVPVLLKKS
jgi:cytochrome P450